MAFVQAPTFQAAADILTRSPELLSDLADEHLAGLIEVVRESGDARSEATLVASRSLIERSRKIGVQGAMEERVRTREPKLSTRIAELTTKALQLRRKYGETGKLIFLDQALQCWDKLLLDRGAQTRHPGLRPTILNDSAVDYLKRFEHTQNAADASIAVERLSMLEAEVSSDAPGVADVYDNLSIAYLARHSVEHDPKDIDHAVEWADRAVSVEPSGTEDFTKLQLHLADALRLRFTDTHSIDDISRSTDIYRELVERLSAKNSDQINYYLARLAAALKDRYDLRRDPDDLEEVERIVRQLMQSGKASTASEEKTAGSEHSESENATEDDPLLELVLQFVSADSWESSQRLCEENEELLSEAADERLQALMQYAELTNAVEMAESVTEHRQLLANCRKVGIAAAFRKKQDFGANNAHSELKALLHDLVEAQESDDIERQIVAAESALGRIDRHVDGTLWAMMQAALASALSARQFKTVTDIKQIIDRSYAALEIFKPGDGDSWAKVKLMLSQTYAHNIDEHTAENLKQAQQHANDVLKVLDAKKRPQLRAKALIVMADAYGQNEITSRSKGDQQVEKKVMIALEEADRLTWSDAFTLDWVMVQQRLGAFYLSRSSGDHAKNVEQAIRCARSAINDSRSHASPSEQAKLLKLLGNSLVSRVRGAKDQNIEEAIRCLEQARSLFEGLGQIKGAAGCAVGLAAAYTDRGDGDEADNLDHAIYLLKQAESIFDDHGNLTTIWNHLAAIYYRRRRGDRRGNLELALQYCEKQLQFYPRATSPEEWAGIRLNEGTYCIDLGEEYGERSMQCLNDALEVFTRRKFPKEWSLTHNNLGTVYRRRTAGNPAKNIATAIQHFTKCLQVQTRDTNPYLWAQAEDNLGDCLATPTGARKTENLAQAAVHYRHALEVFTLRQFPGERMECLASLANLYFELGDWRRAHAAYIEAIETGDSLLAEAYTESGRIVQITKLQGPLLNDAYCLLRLARPEEALRQLQQGQARRLNEALALARAPLGISSEQRQALHEQVNRLRTLEARSRNEAQSGNLMDQELAAQLRKARRSLAQLTDAIRSNHPDFISAGLNLGQLLDMIPVGGALVAPVPTDHGTAVIVVPQDSAQVGTEHVVLIDSFTKGDMDELLYGSDRQQKLEGWIGRSVMLEQEPDAFDAKLDEVGRRLWTDLLSPVLERLDWLGVAEGAQILLMPTLGLGLLPVHAAWREIGGVRRYLLDDYTITFVPSAVSHQSSRAHNAKRSAATETLLAVVDPTSDLEFAAFEAEAISACFVSSDVKMLRGPAATSDAVVGQIGDWAYLHFCCHGRYDWDTPMESSLLLADGTTLTLNEILSALELKNARMVVLSACQTGITDISRAPEEHVGLATAFLQAGASAVVSTLWSVADSSTMLLMERFYHLHLKQGRDPALALREAQLWLRDVTVAELEERFSSSSPSKHNRLLQGEISGRHRSERLFAHPYHWAAFVINGG